MKTKVDEPLLGSVREVIETMDEKDALMLFLKVGFSVSFAEKFIGGRYRPSRLNRKTKAKLEKVLAEAS